eukprot:scaffold77868_cov31-Tisochrysis_lutea.AAC.1
MEEPQRRDVEQRVLREASVVCRCRQSVREPEGLRADDKNPYNTGGRDQRSTHPGRAPRGRSSRVDPPRALGCHTKRRRRHRAGAGSLPYLIYKRIGLPDLPPPHFYNILER